MIFREDGDISIIYWVKFILAREGICNIVSILHPPSLTLSVANCPQFKWSQPLKNFLGHPQSIRVKQSSHRAITPIKNKVDCKTPKCATNTTRKRLPNHLNLLCSLTQQKRSSGVSSFPTHNDTRHNSKKDESSSPTHNDTRVTCHPI